MLGHLARRAAQIPPLLLAVSVVIFGMLRFSPGDPAEIILSQSGGYAADRETVSMLHREWGLDVSLPVQCGRWLYKLATLDLGRSFATSRPVSQLIAERLPATLLLAGAALFSALAVALPLGVLAAFRAGGLLDGLCRVLALIGVSLPGFWMALLLVWTFSVRLGWLPAVGGGTWRHAVLPVVALATSVAATQVRLVRASVLDVLSQPYLDTARGKGLTERLVLTRHVLRNALLPPVTALGLSAGGLLGGAAVVETVFAYPGMGKLVVDSIGSRDYPVIQAFVLLLTLVYVGISLLVDLICGALDPRVRLAVVAR
ncbi:MAG: ABC transporter permease [Chloroflexota bacterium]